MMPEAAIYDKRTFIADLSAYRTQILEITRECADGIDNDGDGQVDWPDDDGCADAEDLRENECDDGVDNDGDTLVDYGDDPGCRNLLDASREAPPCNDGVDNDGDAFIDYGLDPNCQAAWDTEVPKGEANCGLFGVEVLLVWPLARAAARRRRAPSTASASR